MGFRIGFSLMIIQNSAIRGIADTYSDDSSRRADRSDLRPDVLPEVVGSSGPSFDCVWTIVLPKVVFWLSLAQSGRASIFRRSTQDGLFKAVSDWGYAHRPDVALVRLASRAP